MTFRTFLQAQSGTAVLAEALACVLLLGVVDYFTGWELSLFLFYAFPILFVAWYADRKLALVCSVVCGVTWFAANLASQTYGSTEAYVWASINRLVYLVFVAIGGSAVKQQQEEIRGRLEAMIHSRELEHEIIRISEREQMRIGQDLHDGLCQNLAAIDCATACLKADLDARSAPEASTATVIQQLLRESLLEARNIARGISPVQVDGEGFGTAIEELVTRTNQLRQTAISFTTAGEINVSDPHLALHLYRITQESISNAVRHSGAAHIGVALAQQADRVTVTVSDDGQGIDLVKSKRPGMGLQTMRYRARLIGAEFEVSSKPAGGTVIRCSVPVAHRLEG